MAYRDNKWVIPEHTKELFRKVVKTALDDEFGHLEKLVTLEAENVRLRDKLERINREVRLWNIGGPIAGQSLENINAILLDGVSE